VPSRLAQDALDPVAVRRIMVPGGSSGVSTSTVPCVGHVRGRRIRSPQIGQSFITVGGRGGGRFESGHWSPLSPEWMATGRYRARLALLVRLFAGAIDSIGFLAGLVLYA